MNDWFLDPLGGLSSESWDSMAGSHFYSSAFWLRLCGLESSEVGGVWCDIPEGGTAGVPVVRATAQGHPNTRWNTWLAERDLPLLEEEGIYVGQVRGYKTDLLASNGADPVAAARAVLQRLHAPGAPLAGKPRVAGYLTTSSVDAFRVAGVASQPVFLGLDASVHVPPGGREAWLDSVGRHRAKRLRSERRRFEAAGYTVTLHPLAEVYPLVARLSAATVSKYQPGAADEAVMREGFRQQAAMAQDLAQVLVASSDGEQVGCCLFYRCGDTVYLRAVGFDYPRLKNAAEYPTLAYDLPARWEGVRRIHAGIGSSHAKALRGAVLQPLWLLDLSDSGPSDMRSRVVRHNEDAYRELHDDPVLSKAVDHDQFELIG